MKLKVIISAILILVLSISLVSCGNRVSKSDAKDTVEAFFEKVEEGDFEGAKGYLHPEMPRDLEGYFNALEERISVDFQKGVEIKRYTSNSYSAYETEVDGSERELDLNLIVDGVALEAEVTIVKNDLGYGIYSFEIDFAD